LLVGYLEENFIPGDDDGVIVPMPTFVGPRGREWHHIALVLERVAVEDRRWPLAPGAIVKSGPSRKMVGLNWQERSQAARDELAPLLSVPDPQVVAGRNVLVYDDVFTSGTTLREVSLKLQAAGALQVDGVVLARQPFRG
jgi:predicted amidophosphoribosyltransferase